MAAEGTGYPGQIQVRDPDTKEPQDVYGENGVVRVGLRYYNEEGVPQAQEKIATEESTQELIDLFKWERFDEIVEDGGYMYFGFRSRTDSTYRVKRIKDDTHAAAYCYGDGDLPASAGWTGLVYA